MADEPTRISERSNKGVPPKRFDMDSPGGPNVSAGSTSVPSQEAPTISASQGGNRPSQQKTPQNDFIRALADMQREMMRQINAVNLNLNNLITTQKDQTNASIALLQQEIRGISEHVATNSQPFLTNRGPTNEAPMESQTQNNGEFLAINSSLSQTSATAETRKLYPLPKFGGLPEWPTFIEDFRQTTIEFEYSPLQNIIRMREALYGAAKETVESLLSSSKNVEIIIEVLAETYGRPEQLIRSQIEKVKTLSYVPEGRLDLLINFSTKVSNMVRFLQTANGQHHLSNPTLLSELVSKLPHTKQMQWAERCIALGRPINLMDFCEWLDGVRRVANMVSDGLPSSSASADKAFNNKRAQTKNKFMLTSSVKQCVICAKNCNSPPECPMFQGASIKDRWEKARELHLCFSCLKGHHQASKCFRKHRCGINNCQRKHNSLLHAPDDQDNKQTNSIAKVAEKENSKTIVNLHAGTQRGEVLFQIIPVKLYGPNGCVSIYAFIDDGADTTMLEWEVGEQIGLQGELEKLKLQWLNGHCSSQQTKLVDLDISGNHEGNKKYKISNVYLVRNLELPIQSFSLSMIKGHKGLAELPIENYHRIKPQMIISLAHAFLTVPVEIPICPDEDGPIAVRTKLGWVIYGSTGTEKQHKVNNIFHSSRQKADTSMEQRMNEIESCLVKLESKPVISNNEERAMNILRQTTEFQNSHYECGLLWKNEIISFPDSYGPCLRRLHLVEKKFMANPTFENEYRAKMQHLLDKGYARRLTVEEERILPTTFFLPHFAVNNPSKDKLRLVFDAAAKVQGVSLNDKLLPGPDLNQSLLGVLFKFREHPIAVCADIKEMFLQVRIRKRDQDSQRFLYRENVNQPVGQYVMTRAIFGAACSPTIAQYIKNLNAKKYLKFNFRAVEAILKHHYVDDYVDCFKTVEEGINVVKDVIHIHAAGGFEMHKLMSNSAQINEHFGNSSTKNLNMTADNVEKILGMHWSAVKDEFIFDIQLKRASADILEGRKTPTKREVLSAIMSVFDPFGLLANFTISGKIFMQQLWKSGLDWDAEIPEVLRDRWKFWISGLNKVRDFRIPRCYFYNFNNQERSLHVFCDASEMAMATVAYWRTESSSEIKVCFVAGKANCAPSKFMTIPRLELQAAVMAVRLKNAINKHHDIQPSEVHFWTDSSTVVKWLNSDHRRYKQFVANRVAEILESSDEKQWHWVPGEMNPADEATRPRSFYNPDGRWKNGPEFLRQGPEFWPSISKILENNKGDEEYRSSHFVLATSVVDTAIFDARRFSNYRRLKRHIGWVHRYITNLKLKCQQSPGLSGDLSIEEEEQAERFIIRSVQKTVFADEYHCIIKREPISASSSLVSFNPYIDEYGNLRCGGRLDNASCMLPETKRPLILPKTDRVTHLLVQWYHEQQRHINDHTVICEIRLKYWIPSIRVVLKAVKSACCRCKINRCKPCQPIMGPLPEDRLKAFVRPFSYTGLDYFGPVIVSIRRRHEKRWVALFTCLVTRSVHLELATDLSSDSCLLCIRNFVNRRGIPCQIRSDNGTNFVGIGKELGNENNFLDFDKIDDGLKPLGIKWKFNTPLDPSAGGAWERLVQSVKRALNATLREHAPRLETLNSLLIECENIVNSRPLTHLPVTPHEPEPLTPNHFLLGCPSSTQTPAPYDPKLCSLRKQWRILQNLKNCLWKRWVSEYLPELTRRTKWNRPSIPMVTGALVLICEADQARSKWKRGRIQRLIVGKDGVARSAEVSTASGLLRRPISKLAVLDVESEGELDSMGSIHGGGDVGNAA